MPKKGKGGHYYILKGKTETMAIYKKVRCDMKECHAYKSSNGEGWCQCLSEPTRKRGPECPFYKTKEFKKAQELRLYGQDIDDKGMYFLNIGEDNL